MIKTTVAKLINAQEVLQKIVDTELPARECWKALRVLREIEKEVNTITNTRRELCKKYAELDEQGNFKPDENGNYIIKDNCEEAFVKETNDFAAEELEIDTDGFDWNVLERIDFTPAELVRIEDFIKEE